MPKQSRLNNGRLELWLPMPLPGGWVCGEPDDGKPDGVCGMPVESEPCDLHKDRRIFTHRDTMVDTELRADTYPYGGGVAGTGLQITLDQPGAGVLVLRLPAGPARALAEAILTRLSDSPDDHTIEFGANGWTIQHPLACRPNLFDCPVNRIAAAEFYLPQGLLGRFECSLNDLGDTLLIGDRIKVADA
jgi:hypothetical protein